MSHYRRADGCCALGADTAKFGLGDAGAPVATLRTIVTRSPRNDGSPRIAAKPLAARASGQGLHLMPSTEVHPAELAPTLVSDFNGAEQQPPQSREPSITTKNVGTAMRG